MRSPNIYSITDSSASDEMSSLEPVKSLSTLCIEESDSKSGAETDSSTSSMDESRNRSSSVENGKDSGVDCGEHDFIVPDKELIEKIVNQVESYFSDENLIKDEFILKHIRRNKEGFISLKLVASLRKVKVLTKNWKVVAHCIKVGSDKLQINDSCTKIRRITPLPAVDGTKNSRTLIAYNFPHGNDTIDQIGKQFSKYGDISLIRISRPNPDVVIAPNLLTAIGNKFDVYKTTFATIEFNNKSDAEKALKNIAVIKKNDWRNNFEVFGMNAKSNKTTNKCSEKQSNKEKNSSEIRENSSVEKKRCAYYLKNKQNLSEISTHCQSTNNAKRYPLFNRQKSNSYSAGDESNPMSKIFDSKQTLSQRAINRNTNTNSTHTSKLPANIIRYPLGPDGTKGFNTNRQIRSNSEPKELRLR